MKTSLRWLDVQTRTERVAKAPDRNGGIHGRGHHSDPTGETAANMEAARALLAQADQEIRRAFTGLYQKLVPAFQTLHRAERAIDGNYDPLDNRIRDAGVSDGELEQAEEAKARRAERGEGYGVS